jgi:hypothetical protein
LLLSALVVCLGSLISLSLLATARGGASFLGPKLISASGNRYTCLIQIQPSSHLSNPALHTLDAINLINPIMVVC